jgi:hypothetical protein
MNISKINEEEKSHNDGQFEGVTEDSLSHDRNDCVIDISVPKKNFFLVFSKRKENDIATEILTGESGRSEVKENCDFNDFLLSNSPVNLSPENSDQEDEEDKFPSHATGNWSAPSLRCGEAINTNSYGRSPEKMNFPSLRSGESLNFPSQATVCPPERSEGESLKLYVFHPDNFEPVSVTPLNSSSVSSEPTLEEKNAFDSNGDISFKNVSSSHKPHFRETIKKQKRKIFTRLTYENVERNVSKYYLQNKTSNKFDVLITYLQSKKNIYIQSQNILQIKLNIINALTLFLTATVAIFAPFMYNYNWSSYFISAVNSMIAILIKLKDGFKYEANIENYNKLSNQFNNLETSMQLTSNKLQFIKNEDVKTKIIIEKIEYLEERLIDINNNFKMIFPEIIKKIFPIITHINIFTFIKKIESYKHHLIIDLQNVKNEIMYITHKWNMNENIILNMDVSLDDDDSHRSPVFNPSTIHRYTPDNFPENKNIFPSLLSNGDDIKLFLKSSSKWDSIESIDEHTMNFPSQAAEDWSFAKEKDYSNDFLLNKQEKFLFINDKIRLQNLLKIKENIKIKLFHYKKIYEYIDEIFNEEIKKAESFSYWLYMIFIYKNNKNIKKDYDNPIVRELIKYAI